MFHISESKKKELREKKNGLREQRIKKEKKKGEDSRNRACTRALEGITYSAGTSLLRSNCYLVLIAAGRARVEHKWPGGRLFLF